jgi:uncharacterized protein (TIGR04255 family)
MAKQDLPSFRYPPVVEVVMGVQFSPLGRLLAPYSGLFWQRVREHYPNCREQPPIVPQKEDLSGPAHQGTGSIGITATFVPDLPRLLFENTSGEWLIQLQKDRFLHNWRKSGELPYPRYPAVKDRFFQQYGIFQAFLDQNNLGPLELNQYELTYLNHIAPWNEGEAIGEIFPDFNWRRGARFLNSLPESLNLAITFTAPDQNSRLRMTARTALNREKQRIVVLDLTVRGYDEVSRLEQWFDSAREWIVQAFKDVTSEQCHQQWQAL